MKSKRALYGTLGIAMMGVMSSSFFGSTSGHEMHSISLSQMAPPAGSSDGGEPNPSTTTHATTPAEKAEHQKRVDEKKAADAKIAADKKAADEKKAADDKKAKEAKEAKEKKAKEDDKTDAQASDDTDKTDKKADAEEKTLSVKSKGATYLFKGDHSKGKVQTQIYTDAAGNVVERKMRAINATAARVAPDAARGSVCLDCEAEAVEILIPVNASAQEILVAYQAKADSMEETVHAEDMRKKKEREATCEEPSEDQMKRAHKDAEIAAALCQADLYSNSKTEKADKQDIFEKLKDMIVELATSDASDKTQARKDLDKAKKLIAGIKKSDLRTKLEDTLKKAQASVTVGNQMKQVNGRADQALQVLNEAYDLCPSLQNTRIGQNVQIQNQQFGGAQQCGYASQMRIQAVQALNYDATQMRRYAPSALVNAGLIARNPLDSGLSYDQAENLVFRPYVDFANNFQGATGQSMLSNQDRSMLQGLAGMEAYGPAYTQQTVNNTGLNSPLLQNNLDMNTFRTAQANGQQLSMVYPQIQGLNINGGLNNGLNNNGLNNNGLNLNNNQMIRPVVNQNLQLPQTTLPNTQFSLLNNSNPGSYNGGLNYMSGTYVAPNFTSNTLSTPQSTQLAQTGRTLSR